MVLKLWQARDSFVPERLMQKFEDRRDFDWNDLGQLLRRNLEIDPDRIAAACIAGFRFLRGLTAEEQTLARDSYQREYALWEQLGADVS